MNKTALVKKVSTMDYGDVLSLVWTDKAKDESLYTMVSKTRWFDSYAYIIGGAGDQVVATTIDEFKSDIENAETIVNAFIEFYKINENTMEFKIGKKANVEITFTGSEVLTEGHVNNIFYNKSVVE